MHNFAIITDPSCDLDRDLRLRFGIDDYLPSTLIFPDGHAESADPDWQNISPKDFFESMNDRTTIYKTAMVNIFDAKRVFQTYLEAGRDILSISISSALSGTYGACVAAAHELLEQFPDRKIICIDSLRYSTAQGLMCVHAGMRRAEGLSIDETADWLNSHKYDFHQIGTMEDLFFCSRVGRISNAAAFMGTLMGIKPMADFDRGGLSHVLAKTRGSKNARKAIVEYIRQTSIDPSEQIFFVAHSNRPELAEKLKTAIENEFHPREIIVNSVGQFCGPSIGPGLVAAFYFGQPISSDSKEEEAILKNILAKA